MHATTRYVTICSSAALICHQGGFRRGSYIAGYMRWLCDSNILAFSGPFSVFSFPSFGCSWRSLSL